MLRVKVEAGMYRQEVDVGGERFYTPEVSSREVREEQGEPVRSHLGSRLRNKGST